MNDLEKRAVEIESPKRERLPFPIGRWARICLFYFSATLVANLILIPFRELGVPLRYLDLLGAPVFLSGIASGGLSMVFALGAAIDERRWLWLLLIPAALIVAVFSFAMYVSCCVELR
jgi:hypothetical protein